MDKNYSSLNLGKTEKTTLDMGILVPIFSKPVMPGDNVTLNTELFIRGMPTIAPIMDKVDIKVNFFHVPYRILWDYWQDFQTLNDNWKVLNEEKPQVPSLQTTVGNNPKFPYGRLADYLGIPTTAIYQKLSLLPFLAYHKIYLDWFVPSRWLSYKINNPQQGMGDIPDKMVELNKMLLEIKRNPAFKLTIDDSQKYSILIKNGLHKVGWSQDYFSMALPTPTLFNDVKLPITTLKSYANNSLETILKRTQFDGDVDSSGKPVFKEGDDGSVFRNDEFFNYSNYTSFGPRNIYDNKGANNFNRRATYRDFREHLVMQHFLEKMQIGGGRYAENLETIFGVKISDGLIQRSEYLGGSVNPLFVNEIESTADTKTSNTGSNLGDLAGKPLGAGKTNHFECYCEEYGLVMAIAHIVPKRTYTNTLDKSLWVFDNILDLPIPGFEGVGDEALMGWELDGAGQQVIGYVPRYENWRRSWDSYSGEMRHSLKHWHMGNEYKTSDYPQISTEFIECNPRVDIFNVPGESDKFFGAFKTDMFVKRKLENKPLPGISYI